MNDMSVLSLVILFLVPPVAVGAAMLVALKNFKRTGSGSRALKAHFASLAGVFTLLLCSVMGASAETAETAVRISCRRTLYRTCGNRRRRGVGFGYTGRYRRYLRGSQKLR